MLHKTDSENIRNIQDLLSNVVDLSKITKTEITRLTAPGENYGSLILKLDVTFKSDNENTEDILHLVAKKIPSDELFQQNFNIQVTFKNEVALYETIVPILQNFQRENGVKKVFDSIPKFYCARFNLDGSEKIDEDAVLVLENLVAKGYTNVDRIKGFSLESTKLILEDLAEFHAVPLALKLQKPQMFEEKLKKYCQNFTFNKDFHKMFWGISEEILLENENCAPLADKVNFIGKIDRPEVSEPFATLVHADLWCNNTMQKFVQGEKATKNKFLDFQFLSYGSPASDLLFFLFTSVQQEVLKHSLDDLIEYYHSKFIENLINLNCSTTPFSFDNFLKEIKQQSVFEIGHAMQFVLFIVNGQKGDKELKLPEEIDKVLEAVTPKAKGQVWFMVEECNRRGWL